jgi:hypothetical protein
MRSGNLLSAAPNGVNTTLFRALKRETASEAGDFGPVLFWALSLFAAIWAGEAICVFLPEACAVQRPLAAETAGATGGPDPTYGLARRHGMALEETE